MWVEKLKSGKYRFVERYTDYMTGKEKRVSVTLEKDTAHTRKLAAAALQSKIEMALTNVQPSSQITLKELVNRYRVDQEHTVKKSTARRNYFACETLMKILGAEVIVDRLSAGYVRNQLLNTGKEPGTLNEHIKRLKALIRWGYKNDFISDIRWLDKLDLFKDVSHKEKIKDKYLEASELKQLLDAMDTAPRWRNLTLFLALSGLRFGEAAALSNSDVNVKTGIIQVNKNYDPVNKETTTPKTSCSIREVYMQPQLRKLCNDIRICNLHLRDFSGYEAHNLFLEGPDGDYINFFSYNKYLKETSKRVLGRKITAHTLRHTHASLLMEQGIDINVISRRLGHENSKITKEVYLHVTEELKKKDNEQLEKISLL